jgi:hypothetical protein
MVEGWLHDPPLLLGAVLAGEPPYIPGEGVVEKSFAGRLALAKSGVEVDPKVVVRVDMVCPAAPPAGGGPPRRRVGGRTG